MTVRATAERMQTNFAVICRPSTPSPAHTLLYRSRCNGRASFAHLQTERRSPTRRKRAERVKNHSVSFRSGFFFLSPFVPRYVGTTNNIGRPDPVRRFRETVKVATDWPTTRGVLRVGRFAVKCGFSRSEPVKRGEKSFDNARHRESDRVERHCSRNATRRRRRLTIDVRSRQTRGR